MLLLLSLLATSAATPPSGPLHLLFRNDTLCTAIDANHTCAERAVGKQTWYEMRTTLCAMRNRLWCSDFCPDKQLCADVMQFVNGTEAAVVTPMYADAREAARASPVRSFIEASGLYHAVGTAAFFMYEDQRNPVIFVQEGGLRLLE
jgi:hypothetical protein